MGAHPYHFNIRKIRVITVLGFAVIFAGCAGPTKPCPVRTMRYCLADTAKVSLMDGAVRQAVECTGLQVSHRKDGRLEVVVSLKNLGRPTLGVEVNATFKGPAGEALTDETPWHRLTLEGNNTVVARFVSRDMQAADFVVRVRAAK